MEIIDNKIGISNQLKIIPNDVKCPKCKCINKWQVFIDITIEDEMEEEDHDFECNSDESDNNTQTQVTQTQVTQDIMQQLQSTKVIVIAEKLFVL